MSKWSDFGWLAALIALGAASARWPKYSLIGFLVLAVVIVAQNLRKFATGDRSKNPNTSKDTELREQEVLNRDPRNQFWEFDEKGMNLRRKATNAVLFCQPWCIVERVDAFLANGTACGINFDISGQWDSAGVDWDTEGADAILQAMSLHLANFDADAARQAIARLGKTCKRVTIYKANDDV